MPNYNPIMGMIPREDSMPIAAPIAAAGISAIGGLLGGLFGGKQKKQEMQMSFDQQQKLMDLRRKYIKEDLAPTTPFYEGFQHLPQFDVMMKKFVLGRMQDIFGGKKLGKYGIDIGSMFGSLGSQPQGGGGYERGRTYQPWILNRQNMASRTPLGRRGGPRNGFGGGREFLGEE